MKRFLLFEYCNYFNTIDLKADYYDLFDCKTRKLKELK